MNRTAKLGPGVPEVCRLALAGLGRYGPSIDAADVRHALDRGINALIWAGTDDAIAKVVSGLLASQRAGIAVIAYLEGRTASEASMEIDSALKTLGTPYLDVILHGYVETVAEWEQINGTGGAGEAVAAARRSGKIKLAGFSSHQRSLAAELLAGNRSGPKSASVPPVDVVKVRYNAAHRGAETEVFPVASRVGVPVITFTAQRWGALNQPTPDDPAGFIVPEPREWYRFVLSNPLASLVAMAPGSRAQLDHALGLLDDWRPVAGPDLDLLRSHGDRVRKHAGSFS